MRSLYRALGVDPGADDAQIKAAFRKLAKRAHPDVNSGEGASGERFKEIHQAYRLLRHPQTRAVLDSISAHARAAARRRWLMTMATMAATFILTVSSGVLFLTWQPNPERQISGRPTPPTSEEKRMPPSGEEEPHRKLADLPAAEVPAPSEQPSASGTTTIWSPAAVAPVEGQPAEWYTYQNKRFGFSLKYPAHVFAAITSEGGDEVQFVSHDGRARLRVSATPFSRAITLPFYRHKLIERHYGGAVFDRTPLHKTWFALSGSRGDEKFYEHVACSCDGRALHAWQLTYPPAQRTFYEPIVEEIRRSFRRVGEDAEGRCRRSQA